MTKKPNHFHKYQRRFPWGRDKPIYKCMVAGCNHYVMDTGVEGLLLNKISECWRCGKAFVIDKAMMKLAKPHCHECTKSKTKNKVDSIMGVFE